MRRHEQYAKNAKADFAAAAALSMRDEVEAVHFLGPCLFLLGFGIEKFLKAVLLESGLDEEDVRKKYQHDLWSMWTNYAVSHQRSQAQILANACFRDLQESYITPQSRQPTDPNFAPNLRRYIPRPESFEPSLKRLSELHSNQSGFALRYPTGFVKVPDPMLLIRVFQGLVNDFISKGA